ncbi:hypothetical protein SAMN05421847_2173 [Halpernia humi]|uniref:Uncharacterized protein n=1 Tax=Halpernia humi TaxID=493375 RepID=A0A1H5ZRG7_9FLAO|nr:hypothetical protein [Halpernia humi]SEG39143.1 hypothetical protein SAMN05421847_2173 [Halpernia humi]
MDEIIDAIQNELATKVNDLKHVDENWGQLDLFGNECPVQWPCALIMISSGAFSNLGTDVMAKPINRQEAAMAFEITFADLKLTNSSFNAPILQKQKSRSIWKIIKKSHENLQGFSPILGSGKMIRTALSSVRRDDGVQEIRVIYSFGLHNC